MLVDIMENTLLMQLTNDKALRLLHELEELNLIKVLIRILHSLKLNYLTNTEVFFQKRMLSVLMTILILCVRNGTIFNR